MLSAASVLAAISGINACTSTPQVVYIKPECSVPIRAPLPTVDAGELWDAVGADTYDILVEREKLIADWALEMESMLEQICGRG